MGIYSRAMGMLGKYSYVREHGAGEIWGPRNIEPYALENAGPC